MDRCGISTRWRRNAIAACAVVCLLGATLVSTGGGAGAATYADTNDSIWQTVGGDVRALAGDDTVIFVGGSFTGVRADADAPVTNRAKLVALDAVTGEPVTTFAPQLDGAVRALALSADGDMLYVGGTFSTVNGVARRGIVALDPVTGATRTGFVASANNDVLDLALDGDDLYLAGRFWNINDVNREKVARVDAASGLLDPGWSPRSDDGTILSVAVDPVLDRVYVGGFFSGVDGVADTGRLAAVDRTTGAVISNFDPNPEGEVYDILARPGRLYAAAGGPGGRVEILDTATGDRIQSLFGDGDLQALAPAGLDVIAGGHQETGLGIGTPASPVARIGGVDDTVDPGFGPSLTTTVGIGIWALLATDTHLWVGGAVTAASPVDAVGVARYPLVTADPVDTTAPTTPGELVAPGVSDVTVALEWAPASDDGPVVEYVVRRDGVALGATRQTTFVDTTVVPSNTYDYTVTAVDLAGNQSSPTSALAVSTFGPLPPTTPVPFGSMWRYLDSGPAPQPDWRSRTYDDATWSSGPAELGTGDGDEATVVANRPVTYLRRSVVVGPDVVVAAAALQYVRDDGVVVSVNGTEVRRDNVADGPITHTTTASTFVFGDQESEIVTIELDPTLFVTGTNVVAVSLHNAPGSADLTFDAQLDLRVGSSAPDTTPPGAAPALTVASVTDGSVGLAWGAAIDDVGVVGYDILRDGVVVGSTAGSAFVDGGLAPETGYEYEVLALDAAGNRGPAAGPVRATTAATPSGDVALVGADTQWAIDDRGIAPPPDWTTTLAAPATWKTGTTEIGVGDGDETTVITNQPVMFARTVFSVGDPTAVGALTLDLLADDGAVAYLNGVEIVRDNVGLGPVDQTTPAAGYRWTVADETTPIRWVVPAGLLQSGPNVLAVSLHNGPGSTDLSFDAALTASYPRGADTEPPGAPTGVVVTDATADSLTISWDPATDDVGVAGYRLQRDGVDIVTLPGRTHVDVGLSAATAYVYTVVAVDGAGNVGPPSGPVTGSTDGATTDTVTVDQVWRYLDTGVDPGPGWAAPGFDDSAWPAGAAELGAGDGDETTVVTNRPVVWFRTSFAVADPAALARVALGLRADDGAVVYLNGIELVRDNVGPGPVTGSTPAASYRWTATDESALRTFDLPVGALVVGTNVLAVSAHNGPGSADLSFAATLETESAAAPDTEPPTAPGTPSVVAVDATTVSLAWTPATDDVAVDRYEIRRQGATVGTSFTTAFVEPGLSPETTYSYRIRAVDSSGNIGALSEPAIAITTPAAVEPTVLIAEDADWRYLDTGTTPEVTWAGVGFDDSAWPVGPAELGAGDGDEATVVANQPVVWFRHTFDVADAATFTALELALRADDGAVVFVNGVEVLRDNVGAGPLDATTPALDYRWGPAEQALRTFALDPAILVEGSNVVAVSVHNGPGSTDLSFGATFTAG